MITLPWSWVCGRGGLWWGHSNDHTKGRLLRLAIHTWSSPGTSEHVLRPSQSLRLKSYSSTCSHPPPKGFIISFIRHIIIFREWCTKTNTHGLENYTLKTIVLFHSSCEHSFIIKSHLIKNPIWFWLYKKYCAAVGCEGPFPKLIAESFS